MYSLKYRINCFASNTTCQAVRNLMDSDPISNTHITSMSVWSLINSLVPITIVRAPGCTNKRTLDEQRFPGKLRINNNDTPQCSAEAIRTQKFQLTQIWTCRCPRLRSYHWLRILDCLNDSSVLSEFGLYKVTWQKWWHYGIAQRCVWRIEILEWSSIEIDC